MAPEPPYVFVSFSHEDRDAVNVLIDAMRERKIEMRSDRDLETGERWDERLREWVNGSAAVLVVWSASSGRSSNVLHEAARADGRLVPVILDSFDSIPAPYRSVQAFDLRGWLGQRGDRRLDQLARTLRERLRDSASSPADDSAATTPPAADAGKRLPKAHGGDIELSVGATTIIDVALSLREARRSDRVEAVDVLLATFFMTERLSYGGIGETLYSSIPEPPKRSDRLTDALTTIGAPPGWRLPSRDAKAPAPLVPDAAEVIVRVADLFSQQTTRTVPVRSRHLVGAAILTALPPTFLSALGTTQAQLVAATLDYVREHWPSEAPSWGHLLAAAGGPEPAVDTPRDTTAPVAAIPGFDEEAGRLLRLAASVPGGDVDATAIIAAALGDGNGDPSIRAAGEMLLLLAGNAPKGVGRIRLAQRVLKAAGTAAVHLADAPDLTAPPTAALVASAAQLAERTTGQAEIGARHLIAAAILDLDPESDLATAMHATPAIARAALHQVVRSGSPADATDAWVTILFGASQPLGGGYTPDIGWSESHDETRDSLGRQNEADMFAALITDDAPVPPLAIGLFGAWGSGKSFFMKLIHQGVTKRIKDGSYAQIRFNAWHYSDANLWASLADEIFEQLAEHVRSPADDPAAIARERLNVETEARTSVLARQAQVSAARERKRQELSGATTRRERTASAGVVARMTRLATALAEDPEAQRDLDTISGTLGLSEPVAAYRALSSEAENLRTETTTLAAAARAPLRKPILLAGTVLVVGACLVAAFPAAVQVWGVTAAGTVALALGWAAQIMRSAGNVTAAAHRFYRRAVAAEALLESTPTEEQTRLAGELRAADAAEASAAAQLADLDARIATLETELAELSGERQLYRFLTERAASNDYKSQLGIVSTIRRDFAKLLTRLNDQTAVKRIVLYIDDLDRCEPQQVVAVLQAIHLLLGTPLFVVVLGVDPRWLERSLRREYRTTVAGSTPREYLEKIFQIPYVLPPMADGFASFMHALAGSDGPVHPLAPVVPETAARDDEVEPAPADEVPVPGEQITAQGPDSPEQQEVSIAIEAGSAAAAGPVVEEATAPTDDELAMLAALGSLVLTPRAATRVFNLYRLVRTTRYVGHSSRFLGTDGAPGEFLVVIQLLALATRSPEVLAELSTRLVARVEPTHTWNSVLEEPGPGRLRPEWDEITAALRELARTFACPADLEPYRTWAPRLSRFTFTL